MSCPCQFVTASLPLILFRRRRRRRRLCRHHHWSGFEMDLDLTATATSFTPLLHITVKNNNNNRRKSLEEASKQARLQGYKLLLPAQKEVKKVIKRWRKIKDML